MGGLLGFLGTVREAAWVYLWVMFGAAAVLFFIDPGRKESALGGGEGEGDRDALARVAGPESREAQASGGLVADRERVHHRDHRRPEAAARGADEQPHRASRLHELPPSGLR